MFVVSERPVWSVVCRRLSGPAWPDLVMVSRKDMSVYGMRRNGSIRRARLLDGDDLRSHESGDQAQD